MRGRVSPRAGLGKVLLSSLQSEKITSRSKGGSRISKDIMPVIMYKEVKRKNCNRIVTKRVA